MSKKIVIVISGKIGSGKDHVMGLCAGYIAREGVGERKTIEIVRFADPLKKAIAGMFNMPPDFLYNDDNKRLNSAFLKDTEHRQPGDNGAISQRDLVKAKSPITYGELQQKLGSHMRVLDREIFVNMAVSRVGLSGATIIIPDLRYQNELEALKQLSITRRKDCKFIFIKLVGQHTTKSGDNRDPEHASESQAEKLMPEAFDYILPAKTYTGETMKHMVRQILIQQKVL